MRFDKAAACSAFNAAMAAARWGAGMRRTSAQRLAKAISTSLCAKALAFRAAPARERSAARAAACTHERWLRVIINLAIGALESRGHEDEAAKKNATPVLLLLEEFPVLKHMEKLETAAGQLAGSGVKLWVIVQNLGQLKRYYEKGWETFIANAGVITAFANADLDTLGYIKGKLGNVPMLVTRSSNASSSSLLSGARPTQDDLRDAALLELDELSRTFERGKLRVLVQAAGHQPLILERALYFKDEMFAGMFDA